MLNDMTPYTPSTYVARLRAANLSGNDRLQRDHRAGGGRWIAGWCVPGFVL